LKENDLDKFLTILKDDIDIFLTLKKDTICEQLSLYLDDAASKVREIFIGGRSRQCLKRVVRETWYILYLWQLNIMGVGKGDLHLERVSVRK
jgi:hypothetical protein